MNNEERRYTIGLNLVNGIGAARLASLVEYFGSAQAAWEASPAQLREVGLPQPVTSALLEARDTVDIDAFLAQTAEKEISILTPADEAYPRRLRSIDLPPPVLYVRGEVTSQDEWAVAIVGTRKYTHYGRQVAEEMAAFLAHNGTYLSQDCQ